MIDVEYKYLGLPNLIYMDIFISNFKCRFKNVFSLTKNIFIQEQITLSLIDSSKI